MIHRRKEKYDEKVLLKEFYYNFAKGEKVGIVGQNGSGKTTMLKMIINPYMMI